MAGSLMREAGIVYISGNTQLIVSNKHMLKRPHFSYVKKGENATKKKKNYEVFGKNAEVNEGPSCDLFD